MKRDGPSQMQMVIDDSNYMLNVQTMQQKNLYTDAPPRTMRIRPVDAD